LLGVDIPKYSLALGYSYCWSVQSLAAYWCQSLAAYWCKSLAAYWCMSDVYTLHGSRDRTSKNNSIKIK